MYKNIIGIDNLMEVSMSKRTKNSGSVAPKERINIS
jgi:hypothetical protein